MSEHDARGAQTPTPEEKARYSLYGLCRPPAGAGQEVVQRVAQTIREAADAARAAERAQIDENYLETRYVRFDIHRRSREESYAAGEAQGAAEEREAIAKIADAVSAQASVMRSMDAKGRRDAAAEIAAAARAREGGESDG